MYVSTFHDLALTLVYFAKNCFLLNSVYSLTLCAIAAHWDSCPPLLSSLGLLLVVCL